MSLLQGIQTTQNVDKMNSAHTCRKLGPMSIDDLVWHGTHTHSSTHKRTHIELKTKRKTVHKQLPQRREKKTINLPCCILSISWRPLRFVFFFFRALTLRNQTLVDLCTLCTGRGRFPFVNTPFFLLTDCIGGAIYGECGRFAFVEESRGEIQCGVFQARRDATYGRIRAGCGCQGRRRRSMPGWRSIQSHHAASHSVGAAQPRS